MTFSKIKIFLLIGFLGSGKTTLIQQILPQLPTKKIGILENEYGEEGIDGELLQTQSIPLFEISNGSIFCSCRHDQFIEVLQKIAEYQLDYLFVESSGISDPSPIFQDLEILQKMGKNNFEIGGIIGILDAENILDLLEVMEIPRRQITWSDLILINKIDKISAEDLKIIHQEIEAINSHAQILDVSHCQIAFQELFEHIVQQNLESEKSLNRPNSTFAKITLHPSKVYSIESMKEFFQHFANETFRIKGLMELSPSHQAGSWYFIDGTREQIEFHPFRPISKPAVINVIMNMKNPLVFVIEDAWKDFQQRT